MAFNDGLNFEPSLEKLASQASPFHVLLSGFLRKSRTFELYETIAKSENLHCRLVPFELADDGTGQSETQLSALLDLFRINAHFQSILVSDPFKHRVQKYVDKIAQSALVCGATNVIFKDVEIIGENFDGYAFRHGAEKSEGIEFEGKHMLFFGCGGVSSAVSVQLSRSLSRVGLVDLDESKIEKLKRLLTQANPTLTVESLPFSNSRDFRGFDYIYNGTGLGKHNSHSPIQLSDLFESNGIAFDANYTPSKTEFLNQMESRGWRVVNGLSHMMMCTAAHLGHVLPPRINLDGTNCPSIDFDVVKRAYEKLST